MNFSKLKLNEGIATSGGTQTSLDAASKSSEQSINSAADRFNRKSTVTAGKARGAAQPQTSLKSANTVMDSVNHLKDIQKQKEYTRLLESQKSDWRQELTEKAVDGQEREKHPFVTVMPTGDENLIQAAKQMKGEVKDKKSELKGGIEEAREPTGLGGSTKEKKPIMGKPNTWGKKPSKDYTAADVVSAAKKKLEEKKKDCKDGYKWDSDEGRCVKKKKSSSTVIIGRGFYGGGHHHDDDDNDNDGGDNDGGGEGGGGDAGGGMGEMFDYLGALMIEDLSTDK